MKDYIKIKFRGCDEIDLSVSNYGNGGPKVYLGSASSVIVFPLDKLDELIEFLKRARELEIENK